VIFALVVLGLGFRQFPPQALDLLLLLGLQRLAGVNSHLPERASWIHLPSIVALSPSSCATWALEVPGWVASLTASRLNSALNRLLSI